MGEDKGNSLLDTTFTMFNDFKRQLEEAVKTHMPNIVPQVFQLIEYCKSHDIGRDNPIDPGYADLYAWYEHINGFNCLLTQDQNRAFLILSIVVGEIYVYEVEDVRHIEKIKPSLEDFATIVIPYLKAEERKWEEFFTIMQNDESLDDIFMGNNEKCSIEPIITISHHEVEIGNETKVHKQALAKPGFDYITDIKILNTLEYQIGQFIETIKEC